LQDYELVGGITMKVEGPVSKPKSVTLKSTVVSVVPPVPSMSISQWVKMTTWP
jgi:hypothetical protein